MSLSNSELWQRLSNAGLVTGAMPPTEGSSPWYVRVMLGVAGWIGACFLLGFVGAGFAFIIRSETAALIVGLLACAAGYGMFRAAAGKDFAVQFALATSLVGQALVVFGLLAGFKDYAAGRYFLLFAFEAILAITVPNFIHRVLTTWAAVVALSFALSHGGIFGLTSGIAAVGFAAIFLDEKSWATQGDRWRPIGYGLALVLIQFNVSLLWDPLLLASGARTDASIRYAPYIGTTLVCAVLLWVVIRLLQRERIDLWSRTGILSVAAATLLLAASFPARGVAATILIMLVGFANGNRPLLGLGLLGLTGFVAHYYYLMQTTLLVKSMVLFGIGMALLLVRAAMQYLLPEREEEAHA